MLLKNIQFPLDKDPIKFLVEKYGQAEPYDDEGVFSLIEINPKHLRGAELNADHRFLRRFLPITEHSYSAFMDGFYGYKFNPMGYGHESAYCEECYEMGQRLRNDQQEAGSTPEALMAVAVGQPDTLLYVSFAGTDIWSRLNQHDIKLSTLGGSAFYTKQETLEEIERHHEPGSEDDDFTNLIAAIKTLPDYVMVEW